MTLHVLYENDAWLPPLREALEARAVPYREHFVDGGTLDLSQPPADGVYLNRMSPSSHTRGHQSGVVYTRELLGWLEAHGRRVINGRHAFDLELSKVQQDATLRAAGILTPRTVAVVNGDLKAAARTFDGPFITKHNQGGKGLGVRLFEDLGAFDAYVDGPDFLDDVGGVTLLQQYVRPAEPFITRVEIVDGEPLYALRSSTEAGFELCPAVDCAPGDAFCPVGDTGRFSLDPTFDRDDPLVRSYVRYLRDQRIDLAGIEFVTDAEGRRWTYDVNGTTNYNQQVEALHGLDGMGAIAAFAERLLAVHGQRRAAK